MQPRTLYDKVWANHSVKTYADGQTLLYIDRHLVQEVSSPQAFEGLKARKITVRRPGAHISVADHAISTQPGLPNVRTSLAALQVERLKQNVETFDLAYFDADDQRHGIVHVIGPELGFTLPGATLVCGDSHTSTHGAFGALAFGIGSSQCETVLATQTLKQTKQKQMRILLEGRLGAGVTTKDIVLAIIAEIGTAGARGHAIEYAGSAIERLSMEARMTLCNMTIEAGARIGMIAPDEVTFQYLKGRSLAPHGDAWQAATAHWRSLATDAEAVFDQELTFDLSAIAPHVSWGTTPADCAAVTGHIPNPDTELDQSKREKIQRSLAYMGLDPGMAITDIQFDKVFIGSCTNGRIEDLRSAAKIVSGHHVPETLSAIVVPGSARVQAQAEAEGLDHVFKQAGFEWRTAGCSMCVAMNRDRLQPGERCASTSNRNFEGRQGQGSRTHLMSPAMAAGVAITGRVIDVRGLSELQDA